MPGPESMVASKAETTGPHRGSGPGPADLAAIAVGGGIGTLARYLRGQHGRIRAARLPIGAQRHLGLPPWALGFAGTGFCGGLTTFSTFGYETLRLLEDGAISEAGVNVIGSPTVGILMAWLGFKLAAVVLARPQLPSVGSASAHT